MSEVDFIEVLSDNHPQQVFKMFHEKYVSIYEVVSH